MQDLETIKKIIQEAFDNKIKKHMRYMDADPDIDGRTYYSNQTALLSLHDVQEEILTKLKKL